MGNQRGNDPAARGTKSKLIAEFLNLYIGLVVEAARLAGGGLRSAVPVFS